MTKNHGNMNTYREVTEHFGLKWRQRDMLDTMDALAFAEVMTRAEDGDYAAAGIILAEAGIITPEVAVITSTSREAFYADDAVWSHEFDGPVQINFAGNNYGAINL